MVAEQDGLCLLHVRVAGHDDAKLARRDLEQRAADVEQLVHEPARELLGMQARVRGDLVVAAPTRVQAPAGCPDGLGEVALDGHVDIFVLDLEVEAAVFDLARDVIEAGPDVFGVFLGDDALLG